MTDFRQNLKTAMEDYILDYYEKKIGFRPKTKPPVDSFIDAIDETFDSALSDVVEAITKMVVK